MLQPPNTCERCETVCHDFVRLTAEFVVSDVKAAFILCCLMADILYIFSFWRHFINKTNLGGKLSFFLITVNTVKFCQSACLS